ncbi:uncharacterized protein TRIADDRAFT_59427 [Trichoplax adhaerens]|uniref:ER membrane protein complex subunit 10 n=1 Tax=Trichoplax adhaerens TaxID=10228 RepID=B3S5P3_TRIAD|nr:hypothetical protein TRIADDRAFT_59427 [Trichoplax adhaerens]EDV21829.1 hypothetical protein TRIADDRAFT_59427 [Trichoplax adhaerens]|eukprot:XP_002115466.1 hypothetical protein TRIADDRAFT_59427 [Trichoplax adhaerens]
MADKLSAPLLLILSTVDCLADTPVERPFSLMLPIEHAFGKYVEKGTLAFKSFKSPDARMTDQVTLSSDQLQKLDVLSSGGGLYRIRIPMMISNSNNTFVSSFVKACSVYRLNSTDEIFIHTDGISKVLSIWMVTNPPYCDQNEFDQDRRFANEFKTTASIRIPQATPSPDTQDYIRMMEEQARSKTAEGKTEKKSFLAKYWMYIVPAFIFMMLMSQDNPQGGGRGEGGSGGGGGGSQ